MANTERVTGPGKGMFWLTVVLVLCVVATGFIYSLHKKFYVNPLDPISQTEAPASVATH